MRKITLCIFVLCTTLACKENKSQDQWQLAFENDANGDAISGSKTELISGLKKGAELRVGFGNHERTWHLTDAAFISIIDDKEVYAQVMRIVGQKPVRTDTSSRLEFVTQNRWTRIIGTNGFSTNYMAIDMQDSIIDNVRDRSVSATWYLRK